MLISRRWHRVNFFFFHLSACAINIFRDDCGCDIVIGSIEVYTRLAESTDTNWFCRFNERFYLYKVSIKRYRIIAEVSKTKVAFYS